MSIHTKNDSGIVDELKSEISSVKSRGQTMNNIQKDLAEIQEEEPKYMNPLPLPPNEEDYSTDELEFDDFSPVYDTPENGDPTDYSNNIYEEPDSFDKKEGLSPQDKKKYIIILVVGILLLLIAGIVLYFIIRSRTGCFNKNTKVNKSDTKSK